MNSRNQIIIQLERLHGGALAAKWKYAANWIERVLEVVSKGAADDEGRLHEIRGLSSCFWSKGEWDCRFVEQGGMSQGELIELFLRIYCCCRDFDLTAESRSFVAFQIDNLTEMLLHHEKLTD